MSAELVFGVANMLALACWIALALFPGRETLSRSVAGLIVPSILSVAYTSIMAAEWGGSRGGFSSLRDVALLFTNEWLLLAGWLHYLAFDLLVGAWEVRDARRRGIPHLLVVPCLALTFLFGPAGWLLYRVVRATHGRARALNNSAV